MLKQIIEAAGDRIAMAGDILNFDDFWLEDEKLAYNDKAWQKRMVKPENAGFLIGELKKVLVEAPEYTAPDLEAVIKGFCETQEIKIGDIIHALRVSVTGKAAGFGMFDTLAILGREKVVNRITLALQKLDDEKTGAAAV